MFVVSCHIFLIAFLELKCPQLHVSCIPGCDQSNVVVLENVATRQQCASKYMLYYVMPLKLLSIGLTINKILSLTIEYKTWF